MAVDEAKSEGGKLHVTRRFGTGTQELCVSGPIVLGVAAKHEEENKPGMRAVITARKKPMPHLRLLKSAPSLHLPDQKHCRPLELPDSHHLLPMGKRRCPQGR